MIGSQTQSTLGKTPVHSEPRPFYVFTTVWLALFLTGIAVWPTVPPWFQSESAITLQLTRAGTETAQLHARLSDLGRAIQQNLLQSDPAWGSHFGWRIDKTSETGRLTWNLSLAGGSPTDVARRLSTVVESSLRQLDAESRSLSESRASGETESLSAAISPWVAWESQPVLTRVTPGRGVTTSQVVLLAALACVISGMFTLWSAKQAAVPAVPTPTIMADQLDLRILGVIGARSPDARRRSDGESPGTGFPWHRLFLRFGEACVILACSLTVLHSVRSREVRELFLSDPLTLFRSVIRPVVTPAAMQELASYEAARESTLPESTSSVTDIFPATSPRAPLTDTYVLPSKAA